MQQPPPKAVFSEPRENYTKVPNELFDRYLSILTAAAILVFLVILRKSWGWQKSFVCISLGLFTKLTGIKSKNTIRKAIKELIDKGLILFYKTGQGSKTMTFYWINTEKNNRIYQAVKSGRLSIKEAQELCNASAVDKPQVIHTDENSDVSKNDPLLVSISEPIFRESDGSNFESIKRTNRKEKERKKGSPPYQNPKNSIAEGDAVEHLQEQRLIQKRLLEESSS